MAQRPTSDFNIDPNITSGTDLSNILNRFQDAVDSGNSGTSRPAYLDAGGMWVKTGNPMRLYLYDGTNDNELYNTTDGLVDAYWNINGSDLYYNDGSVGIGTDNPSFNNFGSGLHIKGAYANLTLQRSTTNTGSVIAFNDENNAVQFKIGTNFSYGGEKLLFAYGSGLDVAMALDNAGNVGIGTDDVAFNLGTGLHIKGTGYANLNIQRSTSGSGSLIDFSDENNDLQYRIGTNYSSVGNNLIFGYGASATPGMMLDNAGRIGIGGSPSRSTKEIEDDAVATLATWDSKDKKPTKAELIKSLTERNIGGGTAKLQVDGDGYFSGDVYANGSPLTRTSDLIETLSTLREATQDETTFEGLRDSIGNAIGGLIEKFEAMQSAATQEIKS